MRESIRSEEGEKSDKVRVSGRDLCVFQLFTKSKRSPSSPLHLSRSDRGSKSGVWTIRRLYEGVSRHFDALANDGELIKEGGLKRG